VGDTLGTAYGVAIVVTLWATSIGLGASHDLRAVGAGLRRRGLFARLIVLDVVVVPLVVVGLVRLLAVPTEYALGLFIVGTASAGPLGLKTAQLARGDIPLAIALVIALELTNIVAMPIWAAALIPSGSVLPLVEIWRTLILGILLPLLIGFSIHAWTPRRAEAIGRWAMLVSTVALAALIGIVLVRDGPAVPGAFGSGVPGVAVGTILVAIGLGWWVGGPDPASRRTAAVVSSVRANTVALVVAGTAFGVAAPATSAIVVFGLFSIVTVPVAAAVLGHVPSPATYDPRRGDPSPSRSAPTS
jgi:bile acid:Na+ symporter, BASS family